MDFGVLFNSITGASISTSVIVVSVAVSVVSVIACIVVCRLANAQQHTTTSLEDIGETTALLAEVSAMTDENAVRLERALAESDRLERERIAQEERLQSLLAQFPDGASMITSASSPPKSYQGPGLFAQPLQAQPSQPLRVDLSDVVRSSTLPLVASQLLPQPATSSSQHVTGSNKRSATFVEVKEAEELLEDIDNKQTEIELALTDWETRYPRHLSF